MACDAWRNRYSQDRTVSVWKLPWMNKSLFSSSWWIISHHMCYLLENGSLATKEVIVTDKTRRQNWKENNQACRKAGCHQPSHHHSGLPNPFCSQSWLWVSLLWRPADCVTNTSLTWSRWGFFKTHVRWRGRSQLKWNQCGLLAWLRSKDLGSKIPWKAM